MFNLGDILRTRAVRAGMRASPMCRLGLLFFGPLRDPTWHGRPAHVRRDLIQNKRPWRCRGCLAAETARCDRHGGRGKPADRLSVLPTGVRYPQSPLSAFRCPLSGIRFPLSARPGGEIGRHEGLRSPCRKAYRFESDPGHHPLNERQTRCTRLPLPLSAS